MLKFTVLLLTLCCLVAQSDKKQSARGNKPPVVENIDATPDSLTFCEQPNESVVCREGRRTTVTLTVSAKDPEGGSLNYKWSVNVGEIVGEGSQVTWNLVDQKFGSHEAKVIVSDSNGEEATATIIVPIKNCPSCVIGGPPCPSVFVKSWSEVAHRAEKIVFYAEVGPNWFFQSRPDYLWTIKGGKILKGQHSPRVEVEVTGEISSDVTAMVQVEGFHPACNTSNSWSVPIKP